MESPTKTLLNTETNKPEEFTADHAERLLKYPGTKFREDSKSAAKVSPEATTAKTADTKGDK